MSVPAGADNFTFIYLGRSPSFGEFIFEFARAAHSELGARSELIVADQTRLADNLRAAGLPFYAVPTFYRPWPTDIGFGFFRARRRILGRIAERRPEAVVTLMPHVWSPLISPAIRRLGIRYATVVHDAEPHPGDPTAWATRWLTKDATSANVIVTLSQAVADQLRKRLGDRTAQIAHVFHPDISSDTFQRRRLDPTRPFRVLFFGRILSYKGLPILVDAVTMLRKEGFAIELGVAGVGSLDGLCDKLSLIGADVTNRWLEREEVQVLLGRYDAVVCPHVEASQSGVVALAFGNGMPVVATPVGGIREQVLTGETGVLADAVSARSLATAIKTLMTQPGLYDRVSDRLASTAADRSMKRFVTELITTIRAAG